MFLGPDERLHVCECPVAVLSVISEDHLSSWHHDGYLHLTANKSSGKRNKSKFAFRAAVNKGGGGVGWGMGNSDSILNLKYFLIHAAKCRWPSEVIVAPRFSFILL